MALNAITLAARIMAADLFRLNVVSQNLANANTTGYKKEVPATRSFVEHLEAGKLAIPVSVPAQTSVLDLRQGTLSRTGDPLDVALEGGGFFELAGAGGPLYTRQGAFRLDGSGKLVTAAGLAVSGAGGDIVLATNAPRIDRQGRVFEGDRQVAQLKIVRFADAAALTPLGGGLYRAAAAGDVLSDVSIVRQGFVEASNVQTLPEMVRMIELMRRFESAQRVVQGYDGMLGGAIRTLGEF